MFFTRIRKSLRRKKIQISKSLVLILILSFSFGAVQAARQIDFLAAGTLNNSGKPNALGKVYFYEASASSTLADVWVDANKAELQTNPVILNSNGEATVFGDRSYYIELYDRSDSLIRTLPYFFYDTISGFGGLYVDVYDIYGADTAAMTNAIAAISTTKNYIYLFKGYNDDGSGDFTFSDNLVFPSNVTIKMTRAAKFDVSTGKTVVVSGDIEAGGYQIFKGAGQVIVATENNSIQQKAWWGSDADKYYFKGDISANYITLDLNNSTLNIDNDELSGDKIEGGTIASISITELNSNTINVQIIPTTTITEFNSTTGNIANIDSDYADIVEVKSSTMDVFYISSNTRVMHQRDTGPDNIGKIYEFVGGIAAPANYTKTFEFNTSEADYTVEVSVGGQTASDLHSYEKTVLGAHLESNALSGQVSANILEIEDGGAITINQLAIGSSNRIGINIISDSLFSHSVFYRFYVLSSTTMREI